MNLKIIFNDMIDKEFTFIGVDIQVGFAKKHGRLYVEGGENVVKNNVIFIETHHDRIKEVIFTVDFHRYNQEAYTEPNITWPAHCMAYSEDAGIVTELIEVCMKYNIPIKIFVKGNANGQHTEYGAFEKIGTYGYENGNLDVITNNRQNDCPVHITTNNIVVAGIAGDYCVLNTIKNLQKYDKGPINLNLSVFMDGICSIDKTNETIRNYCKDNNIGILEINN